jgi:hypothetical protein
MEEYRSVKRCWSRDWNWKIVNGRGANVGALVARYTGEELPQP